jgi:predicted phosphatase
MYKVARSDNTIAYDVDDTLIMWDKNYLKPFKGAIEMTCPYDGAVTYHRPHKRHIDFLKKQHAKGYTILVWSAAGAKWAEAAVKALELEDHVDMIMSKPQKWVDDLPKQIVTGKPSLNRATSCRL